MAKDVGAVFTRPNMEETRGNVLQAASGEVLSPRYKTLFTIRSINHWSNLPKDVAECPPLGEFSMGLTRVLKGPIWAPFPQGRGEVGAGDLSRSLPTWPVLILKTS